MGPLEADGTKQGEDEVEQRNVLISFLGTGRYQPCNYVLGDGRKVEGVHYVQEALVRLLAHDFTDGDRILVFLTSEAGERNWQDRKEGGDHVEGLRSRLAACDTQAAVQGINIPAGRSPEELWKIFATVFNELRDKDRVFFDITHAFRSIPMLGIVLLNYARLLKDIEIAGIYYGAFEARDDDDNAPVFDLTDFATLMEWTSGVQEFLRHGNPAGIAELLEGAAVPRLRQSKGGDQAARLWRDTAVSLQQIAGQIATNRGSEIVEGTAFVDLRERLTKCEGIGDLPHPFQPLIAEIRKKVGGFSENEVKNCLRAANWCLEHGLVQQGLTMLQEGVITMLCHRFDLDWSSRSDREVVSGAIHVRNQGIGEEKWSRPLREHIEVTRKVIADPLVKSVVPLFDRLTQARNDINHAGFFKPRSPAALEKELKEGLRSVKEILEESLD